MRVSIVYLRGTVFATKSTPNSFKSPAMTSLAFFGVRVIFDAKSMHTSNTRSTVNHVVSGSNAQSNNSYVKFIYLFPL